MRRTEVSQHFDSGKPRVGLPLWLWLAFGGLFVAFLLALPASSSPRAELFGRLASQVEEEQLAVYAEQCAPCHGETGQGGVGPALTNTDLSLAERIAVIKQGNSGMPAFGNTLADDDIAVLAAMVDDFAAVEIYATQCAPCHGVVGEGGVGPDLQLSRLSLEERIAIIAEGSGGMPGFAATLTEDEIAAVTRYTSGFTSEEQVIEQLYVQQCAPCHGTSGEGGIGTNLQLSPLVPSDQVAVIRNGMRAMPSFASNLSADAIEALVAYIAGLSSGDSDSGGEVSDDGTEVAAGLGADVYDANCAGCHGGDASGGAGPSLHGLTQTSDELIAVIVGGRGSMPGFGSFSDGELSALVEYLGDLGEPPSETSSRVADGAASYSRHCAGCHGPDASGGVGPSLVANVLPSEEISFVIANGLGMMPGFRDQLSETEIEAVTAYLTAGEEAAAATSEEAVLADGQRVFLAVCGECHGADAAGGMAPSLHGIDLSLNEIIAQVYGGHGGDMPAFEGVLDSVEVQDVARFVATLDADALPAGEQDASHPLGIDLRLMSVVAVIALATGIGAYFYLRRAPS